MQHGTPHGAGIQKRHFIERERERATPRPKTQKHWQRALRLAASDVMGSQPTEKFAGDDRLGGYFSRTKKEPLFATLNMGR